MEYNLTLFFPKEQYSIEKGNNKFVATDKEGNRFIMAANNKQKETISFCKDEGSECKPKQHHTVKDPKVCSKLSDIDGVDHISATMESYGERYFNRILVRLDKHNIDYRIIPIFDEQDFQKTVDEFDKHNIDYGFMEDGKMPNMLSEGSII